MKDLSNYLGLNFIWFLGVVEDNLDPLKLGRVRVRCFEWHIQDKTELPTEHLPWAQCMNGIQSASLEDMGHSPTGLKKGSWVVGFFMDGSYAQQPLVLGTLAGIPQIKGKNGEFPQRIQEPDVSRLARNDDEDELKPSHHTKLDTEGTIGIPIALTSNVYEEPKSTYNAKYPNNHVYQTEGGFIKEIDDTPNSKRIHQHHPSGTFYDIDNSGNRTLRIRGINHEIIHANNNIYIKGNSHITIEGNVHYKINGNRYTEILGNDFELIRGHKYQQIDGNERKILKGNRREHIENYNDVRIDGSMDMKIGKNLHIDAGPFIYLNSKRANPISPGFAITYNTRIPQLRGTEQ